MIYNNEPLDNSITAYFRKTFCILLAVNLSLMLIAGIVFILYYSTDNTGQQQKAYISLAEIKIKGYVDSAACFIRKKEKSRGAELSPEEEAKILNKVSSIKIAPGYYLFLADRQGKILAETGSGREILYAEDCQGTVFNRLMENAKKGGYVFGKIHAPQGKLVSHIGYSTTSDQYHTVVGAGGYLMKVDALDRDARERLFHRFSYLIGFLLLVLAFDIVVYRKVIHRGVMEVDEHFNSFIRYFEKTASDYKNIQHDTFRYSEFINLARSVNKMIDDKSEIQEQLIESLEDHEHLINEIRLLKNYLSSVIESMPSLITALDREGHIASWNMAAINVTGISEKNALGKKFCEIHDEFLKLKKYIESVFFSSEMKVINRMEMNIKGSRRIYEIGIYPISGDATGVVIRMDDRTHIESMDEQLRQAQKMETVGNLAGGLAHDFNNVLGGIVGSISILSMVLSRENLVNKEKITGYIETAKIAAERATDMVKQLLTLARRNEVKLLPVDLNVSLRHVKRICDNSFPKSINISLALWDGEAVIAADPTQIEQVLLNICINASHAMTLMKGKDEPAGGTLSLFIDQIEINHHNSEMISEGTEGVPYWVVSVKDNGVGISRETQEKIFEPFFSTKDKSEGTGLGLSMVYNIVKQHNGFITIDSVLNEGTEFKLYFPMLQGVELSDEPVTQNMEQYYGEGTILVIDDEDIIRETVKSILTEYGYTVILAMDGKMGIEKYREHNDTIGLVICDMSMPHMSGLETFQKIKDLNGQVKILLASGFRQDEQMKKALSLGVDGFISKPFSAYQLAKKVKEYI